MLTNSMLAPIEKEKFGFDSEKVINWKLKTRTSKHPLSFSANEIPTDSNTQRTLVRLL